jgi:hypothetical protein
MVKSDMAAWQEVWDVAANPEGTLRRLCIGGPAIFGRPWQEVPEVSQSFLANAVDRGTFIPWVARNAKAINAMSVPDPPVQRLQCADLVARREEQNPLGSATLRLWPQLHPHSVGHRFDQSLFVRAAVDGVIREAAMAACLTAMMILLFLGSWRSTLIVAISIPLSIICSIIVMSALGQTLNVMTLGGLALAVGILVDDATVEIENIHRNLGQGKAIIWAILDGAQQIVTPTFDAVDLHCLCAGGLSDRGGAVAVHTLGVDGGGRDAGLLRAVAHLSADARQVSPAQRGPFIPAWRR